MRGVKLTKPNQKVRRKKERQNRSSWKDIGRVLCDPTLAKDPITKS